MVALLRGVNVGGKNKVPMADLREAIEESGHGDVRTYIQSGNVVFNSRSADTGKVAAGIEKAIAERFGLNVDVAVRTRAELAAIVDASPYRQRGEDPSKLHVLFLQGKTKASLKGIDADAYAPDEVAAVGRELHLFLPDGLGRSKLAADLSRSKSQRGTVRNWRTVTKLVEMADATPEPPVGSVISSRGRTSLSQ
jgi:uncharacterized protein (DUF1697 family)